MKIASRFSGGDQVVLFCVLGGHIVDSSVFRRTGVQFSFTPGRLPTARIS
jgi:hypothetical protein